MRELEQCVRNILIRGSYRPAVTPVAGGDPVPDPIRDGSITGDELLRR